MLNDGERWRMIHGDCLDVMPTFEAKSCDVIITDPPFVVKGKVELRGKGVAPRRCDSTTIGDQGWNYSKEWLREVARIGPAHVVAFGSYLDLPDLLADRGQGDLRGVFVWRKPNAALPAWNVPHYDSEFFVWWGRGKNPPNVRSLHSMVFDHPSPAAGCFATERILKPRSGKAAHPSQKPLWLMRKIVEAFTKPDDVVLDPFCGTGTTGEACLISRRRFVGIERDADYHAIALKRLETTDAEPPLFAQQSLLGGEDSPA